MSQAFFFLAWRRHIGLPQLAHSGGGRASSSCSNNTFNAVAPPPREPSRSTRSTLSRSGAPDASSAASFGADSPERNTLRTVLRDMPIDFAIDRMDFP